MIKLTALCILGKDIEKRMTKDNKLLYHFTGAILAKKDAPTIWINCTLGEKLGSTLQEYLTKGTKVYIEGTPSTNAYINKGGEAIASFIVWVNQITLLSNKTQSNGDNFVLPRKSDDIPF
jgi:single-stranded DNA-binding protein